MLSNSELELAATEADRSRAREIMDDLDRVGCFRNRSVVCDECDADVELDEDHEGRTETEFAVLRGLVAHRLAATEATK